MAKVFKNGIIGWVIQNNPEESIDFVIIRDEKELNLTITPEIDLNLRRLLLV